MAISVFELFTIGIGPSSSHTVGPMRAANRFMASIAELELTDSLAGIQVQLFGSLGATGRGHGTDKAVLAGLSGCEPESADPVKIQGIVQETENCGELKLTVEKTISFDVKKHLKFQNKSLKFHSNGLRFAALDESKNCLLEKTSDMLQ